MSSMLCLVLQDIFRSDNVIQLIPSTDADRLPLMINKKHLEGRGNYIHNHSEKICYCYEHDDVLRHFSGNVS